jgi:hypothetical protein
MLLSLDIPFFLFPIFFGLTARVIPLRSGLRVFSFHGSSPESMGPSHKADASLRLHVLSVANSYSCRDWRVKESTAMATPTIRFQGRADVDLDISPLGSSRTENSVDIL